jgi:putative ABC transport system ATP-binding protein
MSIVSLEQICKTYEVGAFSVPALQGMDLAIQSGQYIAIMGPSGSGKSTLLNLLGCLDRPTQGRYWLGDQDVSTLDDDALSMIRGARIGFIFQSYNLIAQLNVIENIEVPMFYQGMSESKSEERARELAEIVGLADRVRHKPSELSGGQQQRVAIARALANDPLIILADEPTGNLDTRSGSDILSLLDRLNRQGKTLIIVTHDEHVAARAERVIHLLDGRIDREERNGRRPQQNEGQGQTSHTNHQGLT